MKSIFTYIIVYLFSYSCVAQNMESILKFNATETQLKYLPSILEMLDSSINITYQGFSPFCKDRYKAITMISILFKEVEHKDDIISFYNKIIIDSCIVYSIAFVDDNYKLKWIAGFDSGLSDIRYVKCNKQILKRIMKQNPEAILYCRSFYDNNIEGLLFVKNNKIFHFDKKMIELSVFINKLPHAIRTELDYVPTPNLFRQIHKSPHFRKTNEQIPRNENMLKND